MWTHGLRRVRTSNDWSTMSSMQKKLCILCRCTGYLRMKNSLRFLKFRFCFLELFSAKMKHNALRLKWIKLYQKLGLPLLFVVIFLGLSCYLYLNSLFSLTFWKFLTYFESSFPYISTVNFEIMSFWAWISKNKICKKIRSHCWEAEIPVKSRVCTSLAIILL